MVSIPEKFKDAKKVFVKTTNIAAQAGHPRVYYKIKPSIGYVVCAYTNTCFILSKDADTKSDDLFVYDGD